MKLAIISHTEHYKTADGTLVGWGPTVTEINYLLEVFDTIYHVAMCHNTEAPVSALPYVSNRIIFVPLPVLGGNSISAKLKLLWKSPQVLRTINRTLKNVDWFQFRGPTGIGVYVIPFLTLCSKKKGWYKYAGNWNQEHPPLGYKLQRWMLKQQSRTVTINGNWPNQPKHCITFENPCLTTNNLIEGQQLSLQKSFKKGVTYCFVGRLEKPKGVERIINAIASLPTEEKRLINVVHMVGDGPNLDYFDSLAQQSGVHFIFHGGLSRIEVFEIYKESQVFLLPTTASEGFPKVIAEAMNFGCLPVVSKISAIGQYVKHHDTGICLKIPSSEYLKLAIMELNKMNSENLQRILANQRIIVAKFSFSHYNSRIEKEIINS